MNSQTARTVLFNKTGDVSVLEMIDLPKAEPQENEVRISVEAIGINRAEIMFREGQYLEAPAFPSKLGYEAAGIVDAIGPGVKGFKIGDKVSTIPAFSMGKYGVYGESAIIPASAVTTYPASLSAVEGASLWMQYITAFGALVEYGKLKLSEPVLITAASSSVGLATIQIAKWIGATVIAATRGNDKRAFLTQAGADHVIATDHEDLTERVMEITSGQGAKLIFDPVGGPQLNQLAAAAAAQALIIEYGALSSAATPFPLFASLAKGLTIRGYTLFEITQDAAKLARAKEFITKGIEAGALKPIIDSTFQFEQIADAHRYMESNQQKGKIVVTV